MSASSPVTADTSGRRALIDATVAIIEEDGLEAASMRAITRRASVSHAAPAHHFGDKAGLFTAVALEGFEIARALTVTARDRTRRRGPVGRMQALGVAYVTFAMEHRAHFEVMFRPELLRADAPDLHEAAVSSFAIFREAVREAQADGFADRWDTDDLTLTSWAFVHGIAQLGVRGVLASAGFPEEPTAMASRLTKLVGETFARLDPS